MAAADLSQLFQSLGLPIPAAQFDQLIAACRDLDQQARADKIVQLTLKSA